MSNPAIHMKRIALTLCSLAFLFAAHAQQSDTVDLAERYSSLMQLSSDDYMRMKLPPLHVLLENARESPQVSFYASNKEQEERELKTIRRNWLKYIKLNANYSYGSTNTYNDSYDIQDPQNPIYVYTANGREQSWYNLGVSLSLPLDEIFDRRNRIKRQKEKINSIQFEVERWYDDLSLKIIDAYTAAVQNLSILQSATEAMVTSKAQYKVSEADFINGVIDAQTLSRQRNIQNVAIREYEETRSNLNNALLRLEVLSHTQIITRK